MVIMMTMMIGDYGASQLRVRKPGEHNAASSSCAFSKALCSADTHGSTMDGHTCQYNAIFNVLYNAKIEIGRMLHALVLF